ncbi:ATP-grasp domain-containing protein [Coprobacter tertius]|uniref:ATP-grasp domain-containing protein n=1 Tax=Coprobacter tertius TaxID=2944915 RepID=A0ABT1MK63_9BACT|nr:hypothetical protein [Coprobacter tertius]MCP9613005.1 hypothetical protein [Coprobacter tertius]
MKVAIHNGRGKRYSWDIAWVQYCKENKIPYIVVDCYSSNIIEELKKNDVTHLMWAFSLALPKDLLMARNVLFSAEKMGIRVFPDFNTSWHFDDKVSQKYLLEAVDAPVVPSWAFYEEKEALEWLQSAQYPLVAKLRRGAGSYNVRLIRNYGQAKRYCRKMFHKGVLPTPGYLADGKNKLKVAYRGGISGIINRIKKAPTFFRQIRYGRNLFPKEKGYVYFQQFIPGNTHDLRIAVVNGRVWGFHRKVRDNDFRASGSGIIDYEMEIPSHIVKKSLEVARKLGTQSVAFDYVKDVSGNYYIVEISYGYVGQAIYDCKGYWDSDLNFHKGHFYPESLILEDLISDSRN